jgi:hypothetical protein
MKSRMLILYKVHRGGRHCVGFEFNFYRFHLTETGEGEVNRWRCCFHSGRACYTGSIIYNTAPLMLRKDTCALCSGVLKTEIVGKIRRSKHK